ncbi:hypothetical protein [Pseudonocardia sp. NPDC049635]|uniref:hypothetical protein n=1 Tax=Pseudonocardia sp. NPDC049635 TaxID=3155506 RepID=UPI00340570A9
MRAEKGTINIVNSGPSAGGDSSATLEPAVADEAKGFWARWRKRGIIEAGVRAATTGSAGRRVTWTRRET